MGTSTGVNDPYGTKSLRYGSKIGERSSKVKGAGGFGASCERTKKGSQRVFSMTPDWQAVVDAICNWIVTTTEAADPQPGDPGVRHGMAPLG
jgi:hypothetical protein